MKEIGEWRLYEEDGQWVEDICIGCKQSIDKGFCYEAYWEQPCSAGCCSQNGTFYLCSDCYWIQKNINVALYG